MAACGIDGRIVFFGGVGVSGTESILDVANDFWLFDPKTLTWCELARQGDWPSPRRCTGMTPADRGLFLWGGSGVSPTSGGLRHDFLNDWWHFDVEGTRWTRLRGSDDHRASPVVGSESAYPSPRYTPVFIDAGGRLFLFGGYTEDRIGHRKLNDAWLHDGGTWARLGPDETKMEAGSWPHPRYGCMSAGSGSDVFICGGSSDAGDHNDVWRFDVAEKRWDLLSPDSCRWGFPPQRYCAAFVAVEQRLLMFGGRSRRQAKLNFNDLWAFDLRTLRWEEVHPNRTPHCYDASAQFPGYHAKCSSAVANDAWYIWGGEGIHGHVSDFWRFSFENSAWTFVQPARSDDPIFW